MITTTSRIAAVLHLVLSYLLAFRFRFVKIYRSFCLILFPCERESLTISYSAPLRLPLFFPFLIIKFLFWRNKYMRVYVYVVFVGLFNFQHAIAFGCRSSASSTVEYCSTFSCSSTE